MLVPPGVFHTGAIRLRSRVNLFLAKGAVLRFKHGSREVPPGGVHPVGG